MIKYIEGDIFESPAQVIVNTVNTVGVMGKGLALSFKQRYPDMFDKYKLACEKHLFTIGKLMLFYEADHWILLFPTKENWRNPSKIEYIEKGLMKFVNTYADKNITSIAFPRLGCGNGELDWNEVRPIMEKHLKKLPITIYFYVGTNPNEAPEHRNQQKMISWLRENAKDMSFNGIVDDLQNLSALLPYSFEYNDHRFEMVLKDHLTITDTSSKESFVFNEEEFYFIWDGIRNLSVFSTADYSKNEAILFALLHKVGYLSKIRIMDPRSHQMVDGYQVNEALNRIMALKGN